MITFDETDTHTIGTIATMLLDIRPADFGVWIRRNWEKLPDPIFALRYTADGKRLIYVWSGDDGRAIADIYTEKTAQYESRRKKNGNH